MLGYYKLHEAMREVEAAGKQWLPFSYENSGIWGNNTLYYLKTDVIKYIKD